MRKPGHDLRGARHRNADRQQHGKRRHPLAALPSLLGRHLQKRHALRLKDPRQHVGRKMPGEDAAGLPAGEDPAGNDADRLKRAQQRVVGGAAGDGEQEAHVVAKSPGVDCDGHQSLVGRHCVEARYVAEPIEEHVAGKPGQGKDQRLPRLEMTVERAPGDPCRVRDLRNSVILVVQIEDLVKAGKPAWDAVIEATEHRMRPIALTAAAASLALIPISRQVFWGPLAYAMMGGIIAGTAITLLFLPALYAAWFRVSEPDNEAGPVESPADLVVDTNMAGR